jgi:hypothetical protein
MNIKDKNCVECGHVLLLIKTKKDQEPMDIEQKKPVQLIMELFVLPISQCIQCKTNYTCRSCIYVLKDETWDRYQQICKECRSPDLVPVRTLK